MPDAIGPLQRAAGLGRLAPVEPRRPQSPAEAPSFRNSLGGLLSQVNDMQQEASDAITRFAAGDGDNLHEVMIAVSKAELSFKFVMEARNKLVEAYQEVMRMQL